MFIQNLTILRHLFKQSSRLDFGTLHPPYKSSPQRMRVQHFCVRSYPYTVRFTTTTTG